MTDFAKKLFERTGIQEYDSCEAVVTETVYNGCFAHVTGSKDSVRSFVYGGYSTGDRLLVTVRINEAKERLYCKVDSVISFVADEEERSSAFEYAA